MPDTHYSRRQFIRFMLGGIVFANSFKPETASSEQKTEHSDLVTKIVRFYNAKNHVLLRLYASNEKAYLPESDNSFLVALRSEGNRLLTKVFFIDHAGEYIGIYLHLPSPNGVTDLKTRLADSALRYLIWTPSGVPSIRGGYDGVLLADYIKMPEKPSQYPRLDGKLDAVLDRRTPFVIDPRSNLISLREHLEKAPPLYTARNGGIEAHMQDYLNVLQNLKRILRQVLV